MVAALRELRAGVVAELALHKDAIDAAYMAFTRQARAKPPSMVVPGAYEARARLEKLLVAIDAHLRRYSSRAIP